MKNNIEKWPQMLPTSAAIHDNTSNNDILSIRTHIISFFDLIINSYLFPHLQ